VKKIANIGTTFAVKWAIFAKRPFTAHRIKKYFTYFGCRAKNILRAMMIGIYEHERETIQ
jgi:hypothetical protein